MLTTIGPRAPAASGRRAIAGARKPNTDRNEREFQENIENQQWRGPPLDEQAD